MQTIGSPVRRELSTFDADLTPHATGAALRPRQQLALTEHQLDRAEEHQPLDLHLPRPCFFVLHRTKMQDHWSTASCTTLAVTAHLLALHLPWLMMMPGMGHRRDAIDKLHKWWQLMCLE
jgi:hypothetical protein